MKFDSDGRRLFGTYFGGIDDDTVTSCLTDSQGNVYLSGFTFSITKIHWLGGYQSAPGGHADGFLAKFNSEGSIQWSTFYGGSNGDYFLPSAIDSYGYIYLTGQSLSSNGIATSGAYQSTNAEGGGDAILVKFNGDGALQWGTYYGGGGYDLAYSCAVDGLGNVYSQGKLLLRMGFLRRTVTSRRMPAEIMMLFW